MRILKGIALLILVIIIIAIATVATTLGSERGRLWLVDKGLNYAQEAGIAVEMSGLQTPSLGDWSVAQLHIRNQQQRLLEANNLELRWRPWQLLQKRLRITHFSAEAVHYYQPETNDEKQPEPVSDGPLLQVPSSPLALEVEHLHIAAATLHGMPLPASQALPNYQIQGSASAFTGDTPLALQLDITSLSHSEDSLKISTSVTEGSAVRIKGHLYERPQGLVGTLAQLPQNQAIDLQFEFIVREQHDQIELAVEHLQLPFLGYQFGARGTLRYNAEEQVLLLKQMVLQTDERRHLLEGGINAEDLWLDFNAKQFPLDIASPWVADLDSGTFTGHLQLNWLYRNGDQLPEVKSKSEIELVYRKQHISAQLDGHLKNGTVTLSPSLIGLEQARLEVAGVLDLKGENSDLKATLRGFSSDLLPPWDVPVPPSLAIKADILRLELRGALQDPQVTLSSEVEGRYQQQPFYLDISATGNQRNAQFERLNLVVESGEMTAKGVLDWTADTTDLSIEFDDLKHTLLKLAPEAVREQFPQGLTLTADGTVHLQGSLKKPLVSTDSTLSGSYELEGEELPYRLIAKGRAQIGDPVELDLDVQQLTLALGGQPTASIKGHFHQDSMDLHVELMRLPTQILAALGQGDLRGEAQADLHLTGDIDLPQLSGFVELRSKELATQTPYTLRTELHSEGEQMLAEIHFTYAQQQVGELHIQLPLASYLAAQGPWQNLPLDVRAQGNMDLKISTLFLDQGIHTLQGVVKTDMHVQGTPAQPDFSGSVTVEKGYYHNAIYDTHARDIELVLQGTGETITLKKARAHSDGKGYIELDGSMHWQEQRRMANDAIQLNLRARRFILMQTRELYGEISGEASLSGSFEELLLEGRLEVSPLHASIEAAMREQIPTIEVREVSEDGEPKEALASQMPLINLDLVIAAGQQAYLRGRGLDTELSGKVTITGTAEDPRFVGRFQTVRGRLDIFGRRFVLESGEVRFSNNAASLRIPAVYKTRDIEVRALIAGSADKPELTLTSTPEMPQDELLARLIFAKSVDEINRAEAYRLATAINTLRSGGSGFDPLDSARQMLGVDALTIGQEETENGSALTLGVGKYVNEKVYVELKSSRNPKQPWQGNVQVELTPRLNLETGTGIDGGADARLMWKRDF